MPLIKDLNIVVIAGATDLFDQLLVGDYYFVASDCHLLWHVIVVPRSRSQRRQEAVKLGLLMVPRPVHVSISDRRRLGLDRKVLIHRVDGVLNAVVLVVEHGLIAHRAKSLVKAQHVCLDLDWVLLQRL